MNKVQLKIEGMTCQGCVRTVKTILSNQEGVHQADVDLDSASATIEYDETTVSFEDLRSKIGAMGYQMVV